MRKFLRHLYNLINPVGWFTFNVKDITDTIRVDDDPNAPAPYSAPDQLIVDPRHEARRKRAAGRDAAAYERRKLLGWRMFLPKNQVLYPIRVMLAEKRGEGKSQTQAILTLMAGVMLYFIVASFGPQIDRLLGLSHPMMSQSSAQETILQKPATSDFNIPEY